MQSCWFSANSGNREWDRKTAADFFDHEAVARDGRRPAQGDRKHALTVRRP